MSVWSAPGATLSDKNAKIEYPCLTDEIIREALRDGKLQGRHGSVFGNSYIKLVRSEVISLVKAKFGEAYFQTEKNKSRLAKVRKELRTIAEKQKKLLKEEEELVKELGENAPPKKGAGARGGGRGGRGGKRKKTDD